MSSVGRKLPALLVIMIMVSLLPAIPTGQSATVSYTLWGSFSGWSFTSGAETNPGPTLYADEGDTVQLTLNQDGGGNHFWVLDYNNNLAADPGEPASTTMPTTYGFVADTPGTFTYRCGNHPVTMTGTFVINATNQAPAAVITMPDGNRDWTGGTSHNVVWTMTDAATPVSALKAWLNYSYNAGANTGTIAGPITGSANPHSQTWSVPVVDASDMMVNLTVLDGGGLLAFDNALVPVVDSAAPQVTSTVPTDLETNVSLVPLVNVTFDEPMNQPATESAVSLHVLPSWAAVPLTVQGWAGDTLTVQPSSPLSPLTAYAVNVSAAAADASNPGNPMAAPLNWTFTTMNTTDTTPPVAVITPPAATVVAGTPAAFSGNASSDDSGSIASYSWEVRDQPGAIVGTGTESFLVFTFSAPGSYTVWLTVLDPSGNPDSTSLAVNVEPPPLTVSDLLADPDPAEVPATVNVSAVVASTLGVSEVWFDVVTLGNLSGAFDVGSSRYFVTISATDPGTLNFTVAAQDVGGQWVEARGSFQAVDTTSPAIDHAPPVDVAILKATDLEVNITDNTGLAVATVVYTDVRGVEATLELDVALTPPFSFVIPAQVRAGAVSYRIAATDLFGNQANATFSFAVTGTPPFPTLYGSAGGGWGFGPDNLSRPGPTIEVQEGDSLTITVIGLDGAPHYFFVDWNGNGVADEGEPRSSDVIGNATSVAFAASVAGEYTYYCGIHPVTMHGTIIVQGETVVDGDGPEPVSLTVVLLALAALLALVGLAFLALRRRKGPKGGAEGPDEDVTEPPETGSGGSE